MKRRRDTNQLSRYRPYPKQKAFHAASTLRRERLFLAGNQLGKTYSGGAEAAYHATGRYPDWWTGRRFDNPTAGWASGVTGIATRDTVQRIMLGRPGEFGTGAIPERDLIDVVPARGVADLQDTIKVRHVSGGVSRIAFKSYEQGREKWQGETLDWVWFDEEPSEEIYIEGLTRTNATNGFVWMTFTPLLGMSKVVTRFLTEPNVDREVITMTIDEVEHYTPQERARIVASYPAHEREARAKGIPTLGSGRIFPVEESLIRVDAFAIPATWARLGALDFGWDHPTAAVELAHDRDTDCVYITKAYRRREATPVVHAAALKPWGHDLRFVWPPDALQHDKGSGTHLADQYRVQGLGIMAEHVTFADGSNGVEAGLMEMLDRMETGRFKVFSHLGDWFEEFRLYHRKNGLVVKEMDDLMACSRYGIMGLRFARPPAVSGPKKSSNTRPATGTSWMG